MLFAQNTKSDRVDKQQRKEEKRIRENAIIRQEEEGVLSYQKQSIFALMLRTNGYGVYYEMGKMKSPRFTNLFTVELSEIIHPKEEKGSSPQGFWLGNSYKYGKINNFYQAKLGVGKQYIFGQKGNKNGVAVLGIAKAGLSAGLVKPYYLQVDDDGRNRYIKYTPEDSALFIGNSIIGSGGLGKGWSELKFNPGAYINTALRFDFGGYNETISALEIGVSVEAYSKKVQQMLYSKSDQLFMQAHVAIMFGNRK